ncbi:hypothetical protein EVAR_103786_1 [Eumeta japonica]|uniref:Uncharacterized protein n=1 Tax=Eumeta variegata TaxID=151549 RepID=A0A4C1Z5Y5_EUMVA|nr:hypothetical protein EVAR_103786_1 [Eumeta japonica]
MRRRLCIVQNPVCGTHNVQRAPAFLFGLRHRSPGINIHHVLIRLRTATHKAHSSPSASGHRNGLDWTYLAAHSRKWAGAGCGLAGGVGPGPGAEAELVCFSLSEITSFMGIRDYSARCSDSRRVSAGELLDSTLPLLFYIIPTIAFYEIAFTFAARPPAANVSVLVTDGTRSRKNQNSNL